MKIICIGRNYAEHAKELNNPVPREPLFFCKPDSAIIQKGKPFFYPEFTKDIHFECEIIVRINKLGKHINQKFAHKYFDEVALGLDLTARDLQQECKTKGLPWEKAKAFDGSAPMGDFISLSENNLDVNNLSFELKKNNETVQVGNTNQMIFSVAQIIEHVSKFFTLKIGDLIYTGTPEGVGPIAIDDEFEGFIEGESSLKVPIR